MSELKEFLERQIEAAKEIRDSTNEPDVMNYYRGKVVAFKQVMINQNL